ncbi:hypothetical protein MPTK1_1g29180 [Marchantia polymorpha subsp. ruderalis]|uniref:Uncharacterized protein n=2 Tax=Marchantia polymorpha TaxID=3197 RepID=A0AAF6AVG7_MARPO|nr:hypothetical protein MARPO_0107s0033 [Marchantia polymorpha]BBN00438.1 hypothetical protein Mp_1g29180 [Marchantia polymorpha subsp. ruderalis]|eukprot:PTQ31766.1 hypothetical protein MARPO_0107s0033 [Marchantia polymorpha]
MHTGSGSRSRVGSTVTAVRGSECGSELRQNAIETNNGEGSGEEKQCGDASLHNELACLNFAGASEPAWPNNTSFVLCNTCTSEHSEAHSS